MIHEMPQPIGLFAGELLKRADDFFDAYDLLTREETAGPSHAAYFNLTHAIELLLKAYLASQKVPKGKIRKFSHNLEKLVKCAINEHSMPESDKFEKLVLHLNVMNRDHDFRYPIGDNLSVPPPYECKEIIEPQRKLISLTIKSFASEAKLQFQKDTRKWQGDKVVWSD